MIVVLRLDVDDEMRRAIRARCGEPGLATRAEVVSLALLTFTHDVQDAVADLRIARSQRAQRKRLGAKRYGAMSALAQVTEQDRYLKGKKA